MIDKALFSVGLLWSCKSLRLCQFTGACVYVMVCRRCRLCVYWSVHVWCVCVCVCVWVCVFYGCRRDCVSVFAYVCVIVCPFFRSGGRSSYASVCVCVYLRVRVCVYMYVCLCSYECMRVTLYQHFATSFCWGDIHTSVCVCVCMWVRMCVYGCVCVWMYRSQDGGPFVSLASKITRPIYFIKSAKVPLQQTITFVCLFVCLLLFKLGIRHIQC